MMSRLSSVFQKGPAFVGYLTAGDGGMDRSLRAMQALVKGGVDVLEVGVPFSDPVADGPVIQAAALRALEQGATLDAILAMIATFRKTSDVPIILFSYYNPIYQHLHNDFFKRAADAGVSGCLIVDLPIEESAPYEKACAAAQIDPVFVIAPSTPSDRIQQLDQHARGMLYYACRKGVTGVRNALPDDFVDKLKTIKANSHLPVVAGFGIAEATSAEAVLQVADGFVVGSRFVQAVAAGDSDEALTQLAQQIDPRKKDA